VADLQDGESIEMQGSGAKPYVLKNVGGVYSCTCPAWRNQSAPIERRTCKHLRKLRGKVAETDPALKSLPTKTTAPRVSAEKHAVASGARPVARHFEFVEGKSSKFWEISVEGCEVTVRYGRIGAAGSSKVKTFADAAAAQRDADKLIAEKTSKGYVETGS